MINLGIIPCNNGLGHITRSIQLANLLVNKFKIFLFISKKVKLKIDKKIKIVKIKNNFVYKKNYYKKNWYKSIKSKHIKEIDIFISDNLPEVIFFKKKTILLANFFWHEIFGIKNNIFRNLNKSTKKKNIKILSNYKFGQIMYDKSKIVKIPFIGKYKKLNKKSKKGILISLGTSNVGYENLKLLPSLIKNPNYKKYEFYVDKNLIKNKSEYPSNLKIADFSNNMFDKIRCALIKPGFSTINNCLIRGIPITSYLKGNNKEFMNNAKILKKNKIGNYYFNFDLALRSTILTASNKKKRLQIFKICKKFKWGGEDLLIKYIDKLANA